MSVGRNAPCPCGSGFKSKHCCEGKERTFFTPVVLLLILIVGGVAAAAVIGTFKSGPRAGTGRVWSPEHGHYHNVGGSQAHPNRTPTPRPSGPAPAGKVWSTDHGHWHDAP